jgi:hypothetical protein
MSWGSIRENNTFRTSQRAKREKGVPVGTPCGLDLPLRSQLFSVATKEERQNFSAFFLHCLEFAGIDA